MSLALLGRGNAIAGTAVSTALLARNLPVLVIAGLEMTVGALLLLVWSYRSLLRRLTRRAWKGLARSAPTAASIVALGAANMAVRVAMIYALASIPLGMFHALFYAAPLVVSVLDGRRGRIKVLHAMGWPVLAAVGVFMLTEVWTGRVDLIGVGAGVVAGAARALTLPISRSHMRIGREEQYTAISLAGGAAVIWTWALLAGDDFSPAWEDGSSMALVVALGILATFIPQLAQLWSRKTISDFLYGVVLTLSPPLALAVQLLVGQPVTLFQALGTMTIIVAALGAMFSERRTTDPTPTAGRPSSGQERGSGP